MAECAAPWNKDPMVGTSIPAAVWGHPIFPAQKDERHQKVHPQPSHSALIHVAAIGLLINGEDNNFNVER